MNQNKRARTDQQRHWEESFAGNATFFGEGPSGFAERSLEPFRGHGVHKLLELGCGQGRDTILFAREGIDVTALDCSERAVEATIRTAQDAGLASRVHAQTQDLRQSLSFADDTFDACYSHMHALHGAEHAGDRLRPTRDASRSPTRRHGAGDGNDELGLPDIPDRGRRAGSGQHLRRLTPASVEASRGRGFSSGIQLRPRRRIVNLQCAGKVGWHFCKI